jgi:hypothetical protein
MDARNERMNEGVRVAERLDLKNLRFEQTDIRSINVTSHGRADVVFFLGILYHLDDRDVFPVLQNIHQICRHFVILDTHIALQGRHTARYNGQTYQGRRVREHADGDPEAVRRSRLQSSLDNTWSFWFTRDSLFRLLKDVGFTSVCECGVPLDPFKPPDRITLVALKGEPVKVSCYPWVNDRTEDDIQRLLGQARSAAGRQGGGHWVKAAIKAALRLLRIEIRRI